MADATAIIDGRAREMYEAWITSPAGKAAAWNPFSGTDERRDWDRLDNHIREIWRDRALLDIRGKESVLDELKREDAIRRAKLSERRPSSTSEGA